MARVPTKLTHRDRAFAATAGVSASPFTTPPDTPSRRSSTTTGTEDYVKRKLPKSAYCIIFVEGCERFCYYGLKAVLLLYFMQFLHLGKDPATVAYHLFSFACYFTPTLGAIISDGFIGRYSTILSLSIIYIVGTVVLTFTAIPKIGGNVLIGPIIGLLLIALGTGGVKPCVSAFGADQLPSSSPKQLSRYFAYFYFAINFGSLLSTLIIPFVRSKVQCFDYDCYALAFGIPSCLMLIALIIFILGTPLYKRVPPKENIIAKFTYIIARAVRNAICNSSYNRKEHWIDYAEDKYDRNDIDDVRTVLRVCLLFTPLPVYHALFNQIGSRWTYQASLMNGNVGDFYTIQPDQMQALNSLFVLALIPIFEELLYPAFARCSFFIKPLQRMFFGMLITALAFIVAAILQQAIQIKAEAVPIRHYTSIFNGYNCTIHLNTNATIKPGQIYEYPCGKLLNEELVVSTVCDKAISTFRFTVDQQCPSVIIASEKTDNTSRQVFGLTPLSNPPTQEHGVKGFALLRMVSLDGGQTIARTSPDKYTYELQADLVPSAYKSVLPRSYRVEDIDGKESVDTFRVSTTGVYTVILCHTNNQQFYAVKIEDVPPFAIHILWQTIQYALLTCAEILVSITGLIFAYSQAPKRYKSVIMSAWLLTTAVGDLIVVFVAEVRLVPNQASEFVLFAGLMLFAAFIFGVLAIRYKESPPANDDDEDQQLIFAKSHSGSTEAIPLAN